jgi:glycosyltransferase involved in cell wall biosynthesis
MKNYKVSVIVNCLNGERFVNRSIKSILNQNYQNFEIIFWDNKSIDNSLKIVKKLQKKSNKIRIFSSKKTIKLYEARNKAIEKAKGRYIAFLDIDDTWFKKKLSSQIKKIQSDQTKIIYTNHWIAENGKKKLFAKQKLPYGNLSKQILKKYPICISTVLLEKKCFQKVGLFNKNYEIIGDFDFFFRISHHYKFSIIQKPVATYYIHGKNFSLLKMNLRIQEMYDWLNIQKMTNFYKNNKDDYLKIKDKNLYFDIIYNLKKKKITYTLASIKKIKSIKLRIKTYLKLLNSII